MKRFSGGKPCSRGPDCVISITARPNRPVLINESDADTRLFRKVQPLRRHQT
ncbi:hypothetical protein BF49_2455 [Bradyrhizobium sp.]|nr:hypothetical protein BF49_2455 [Bradyrhizobium sp.]